MARDCVCRAIAIAARLPYSQVYDALNELGAQERLGKRKGGKSSARTGVYKPTYRHYLESLGFEWTPTMQIGSGCKFICGRTNYLAGGCWFRSHDI